MPPRLTAQDFDQEPFVLFDAYVHGRPDRRGFPARADAARVRTPRYDAGAAKLAWERSVAFFRAHVG